MVLISIYFRILRTQDLESFLIFIDYLKNNRNIQFVKRRVDVNTSNLIDTSDAR